MEYIIYKRFATKAISGAVDIPEGTVCTEKDGIIYHGDAPLCFVNSENAYQYFARNNDGKGLERGGLITAIKNALSTDDEHTYERWYRVWNAPVCQQFNRGGDTWLWNFAFYNADIAYLKHILGIITNENWQGITPPNAKKER